MRKPEFRETKFVRMVIYRSGGSLDCTVVPPQRRLHTIWSSLEIHILYLPTASGVHYKRHRTVIL